MRLNTPLITSFNYENEEYKIDLAFDNVLDVFDVINDKGLLEHEVAEIGLALLLDVDKEGFEALELWDYIFKNFIEFEHKKAVEYDLKGNPMPVTEGDEDNTQHISFEQDAEHIYASFKQAYNMNLFEEQGRLHWFEFHALLHGLPSNTVLRQILQIRAWEPSKGDTPDHIAEMKKLQRYYALKEVD